MNDLNAFQKEIAEAVARVTQPMSHQIERLTKEIEALRKGEVSDWMTVQETAEHLKVSPATIRRRVNAGLYKTQRPGGKTILIHRDAVTQV